jgi:1,4-alpha-glucan branching enzyme
MDAVLEGYSRELRSFEASGDHHGAYLARFTLDWNRQALHHFEDRYERNLLNKLRDLTAARVLEPLAGPASHAYLPLLGRDESVRAQIEHGLLHIARHLGRPEGLWLPGCGWRLGLEEMIGDVDLRYVIVDPSSLPADHDGQPAWVLPRKLVALSADEGVAQYIWSPELGYIGDPLYRDPNQPRGYAAIGLEAPQPYDPYHALRRAQEHAAHFTSLLVAESEQRARDDLLLVLLDARLIGTTWFEGPTWLQAVLTLCATHHAIELTTPGEYLKIHRPRKTVTLKAGSWAAGDHRAWQGAGAAEYWQAIHAAETQLVQLAEQSPSAEADQERLFNQAARELLLAQSSDWPELLSKGAVDGQDRWKTYLTRFEQLCNIAQRGQLSAGDRFLLEQLEELDGPFPSLNYRIFAP